MSQYELLFRINSSLYAATILKALIQSHPVPSISLITVTGFYKFVLQNSRRSSPKIRNHLSPQITIQPQLPIISASFVIIPRSIRGTIYRPLRSLLHLESANYQTPIGCPDFSRGRLFRILAARINVSARRKAASRSRLVKEAIRSEQQGQSVKRGSFSDKFPSLICIRNLQTCWSGNGEESSAPLLSFVFPPPPSAVVIGSPRINLSGAAVPEARLDYLYYRY